MNEVLSHIAMMPQWYAFTIIMSLLFGILFFVLVIVIGDDFLNTSYSKPLELVFKACCILCVVCCLAFVILCITWLSAFIAVTFANPGA